MDQTYFQQCLKAELSRRVEKNPRYSMRAFAKALGLDAALLSRILSDKTAPSFKVAQKIIGGMAMSPPEQRRFLASVALSQRARGLKRLSPVFQTADGSDHIVPHELETELFRTIADWYHFAILELTYTRGFKSDPKWIASELGLSLTEAKLAIERLLALGLLERDSKGVLKKTMKELAIADRHLTTSAHRKRQRQILEKAVDSLENDSIESRNHTAMTMAIDPKKLPEAKKMIREFSRKLCSFLESEEQAEVYELSVALFPMQKRRRLK